MFKKLQQKWNVSTKQFWIIFIVFGLTGTTTAFLTRSITGILGMTGETFWVWRWLLKIGMLLIGYQVLLLLFGFLFGQFRFFWRYEKKLLQKLGILKKESPTALESVTHQKKRVAIFASGAGTNALNIIQYFKKHPSIQIELIVCNKPGAGVLSIAEAQGIETLLINKEKFLKDGYLSELAAYNINFIVLAGFLLKVPAVLISAYPNKIINIHPALLPNFGGQGMYGQKVHACVIEAKKAESGITIHYVDENFDTGNQIFQATCTIDAKETPETLAKKIHRLEYAHYPKVIEDCILKL